MFKKSALTAAILALSPFATAQAQSFSCTSWQTHLHIFASVIDVGDQEGKVELISSTGKENRYEAVYKGYQTQAGESRQYFVFGFEDFNAGRAQDTLSLDLNALGTSGELELANGDKEEVTCVPYSGKIEKAAMISSQANVRYTQLGNDNNRLGISTAPHPALKIDSKAMVISENALFKTVKECVFVTEGAYGLHITTSQQNKLSKEFLKDLSLLKSEGQSVRYYRSAELLGDPDTLWAPTCSLIIEIDGKESVMINGIIMD
jgi:hypothetical protein